MKNLSLLTALGVVSLCLVGCSSTKPRPITNPNSVGPRVGSAVGGAVGAVAGNVVAAPVAAVEAGAGTFHKPFDNDIRTVRKWETRTTSDGRVIQVPVDIPVNEKGEPIR